MIDDVVANHDVGIAIAFVAAAATPIVTLHRRQCFIKCVTVHRMTVEYLSWRQATSLPCLINRLSVIAYLLCNAFDVVVRFVGCQRMEIMLLALLKCRMKCTTRRIVQ